MTKAVASCGVCAEIAQALERHSGYHILHFGDEPPAVRGCEAGGYLRGQNKPPPILWLCDRENFRGETERLGVDFYTAECPGGERFAAQFISARLEADDRKDQIEI